MLIVTTLLCSLVSGFLFAFAIVVMPGIKTLSDREFIRAFQVMDGVIQKNQPVFMIAWVGSVLAMIVTVITGLIRLDGFELGLLIAAALIYLIGVQLPTMIINVPLNNKLQTIDVETADAAALESARREFEPRWNRWNSIRTVLSVLASVLLIVLLAFI